MKPLLTATATQASDDQLVSAARRGSDEAFEALFLRYRDRVVGYVRGMVADHGRAEDIVQEAFMSALRALRRTDQPIVFRPWIHEIAKNACIDHLRRARRAQEVSIDSEDFGPAEEHRVSQTATGTDAAFTRRNDLESLRMAFDDLPRSQHQILVMRELEGLSYDSIGNRMGLTRGAVESMLFRARRRLRRGFDEIDTGARCQSMRTTMEAVADGSARARERRRLANHLHHCKACRRSAVALGLDSLVLDTQHSPLHRLAAALPLPAFLRRRLEDPSLLAPAAQAGAEHGPTLAGKAAVVVAAAAIAVGGAGVTHKVSGGDMPLIGGSAPAAEGGGEAAGEDGRGQQPENAAGQPFSGSGSPLAGGPAGPGAFGTVPGATPGTGPAGSGDPGAPLGVGGPTAVSPGGLGAVPGTVEDLAGGDAGGTAEQVGKVVNDVGGTVPSAPGKVKNLQKKIEKTQAKALEKVPKGKGNGNGIGNGNGPKDKLPKVKVPKGDAVTPPPLDLPSTGTTGLSLPIP